MDKKITAGAVGAILLTLSILGGVNYLTDDDVYYCEATSIVMQCDSLSQYYLLPNGKCWNAKLSNKLCRSGWLEIVDDSDIILKTSNKVPGALQYSCLHEYCVELQ